MQQGETNSGGHRGSSSTTHQLDENAGEDLRADAASQHRDRPNAGPGEHACSNPRQRSDSLSGNQYQLGDHPQHEAAASDQRGSAGIIQYKKHFRAQFSQSRPGKKQRRDADEPGNGDRISGSERTSFKQVTHQRAGEAKKHDHCRHNQRQQHAQRSRDLVNNLVCSG